MALLWMDGFDSGEYATKYALGANAFAASTTRFGVGRSMGFNNAILTRAITPSSQVFMGFSVLATQLDGSIRPYIGLFGDSGATPHLSVGFATTGIYLYRGLVATQIATYSTPFSANLWYALEISATIADAGGTCVVKLNGTTVINFTGDTKNGGTSTNIDMFGLGSNGGYSMYYDDLYICDSTGSAPYNTFLGDVRVYPLVPTAAGSSTQFTPSTGANYAAVDEVPYSATDYVSSGTTGNRDLYTMTDLPGTVTTVLAVQNNIVAKKTDAAASILKPAIKSGATIYYGSNASLGASDGTYLDLRTVDPNTATAWTTGGVNALEAGFEVG